MQGKSESALNSKREREGQSEKCRAWEEHLQTPDCSGGRFGKARGSKLMGFGILAWSVKADEQVKRNGGAVESARFAEA